MFIKSKPAMNQNNRGRSRTPKYKNTSLSNKNTAKERGLEAYENPQLENHKDKNTNTRAKKKHSKNKLL